MENWIELLIIILFFAFSALSSIANAKKKKSGDSTLSEGWDDDVTTPGSPTPPLTPVEQPRLPTFDDTNTWGSPPTRSSQKQTDYYEDHRYEQDVREEQQRTWPKPRRTVDPLDDPVVEHRHSQEKTLQDVFREIFQVDIQVKDEPEDLYEPAPQPVIEKKPVVKKPAQTSLERLVKESKERNRKPKISTAPPATVQHRYDHHPLARLALEAQHHPARLAVIYSEILKRPKPLRPCPKFPNQS